VVKRVVSLETMRYKKEVAMMVITWEDQLLLQVNVPSRANALLRRRIRKNVIRMKW
jgi:hypothetical protein